MAIVGKQTRFAAKASNHFGHVGDRRFHVRMWRALLARGSHCISQGEARALSLALGSFAEPMPENLHIGIGNAAAMNIMMKGGANCDALVRVPSLIEKVLKGQGVQTSWCCIASAGNAADRIWRGNRLRKVDAASGRQMRMGARKARCKTLSRFALSLFLPFKHCLSVMNLFFFFFLCFMAFSY
ncbi:hypothetical protein, conserved in T. vivax [Trypanosoma vivax Y486]|uniref:Uncharacterized protein n=1 Tax=Trypanosoma vivax (strain Y486) TaxID=1055687 RepID=F9WUY8_TRYVY|nr:hypothetical protein, conserved in T. vivax [Trypanosoma vivax Y486]|eukprot:CCD21388.1 hypothetical protein, conserved in T. vivax [Trypanosoma vivax Y486]